MAQSQVNVTSSGIMPPNIDDHNTQNKDSDQNHANPETNNNINNHQTNNNNYTFPNLGRQSSIYSLTLDEFQHTLCENGKNFGSMNMDEFLNSIWTAEENQAHHHDNSAPLPAVALGATPSTNTTTTTTSRGTIAKQPSLPRQGSLTLPAPLCRKTVDEVWSEIHRTEQQHEQQQQQPQQQHQTPQTQPNDNSNPTQRQPTFGEMTLEDFLVKAGVVREPPLIQPTLPVPPPTQHHPQYGFPNSFVTRPMIPGYPATSAETSGFVGNGKRNNGYAPPPSVPCYGARVANGGTPAPAFGPPVSPVSPDGMCGPGQVDNSAAQYGLDMAALRGRKRIIDGPVEKVVERRQRRMIKNRESAARSRARKQAYTVELEAELNQLREENTQLKQALAEMERQRKQQYTEEQKRGAPSKAQRAIQKLKAVRRSQSSSL